MSISMAAALERRARETPDRLAFIVTDERLTFGQLKDAAADAARCLSAIGLRRGDRCAIALPTGIEAIVLAFAAQMIGAAPVMLDAGQPPALAARRIRMLSPAVIVATELLSTALAATVPGVTTPQRLRQATGGAMAAPVRNGEDLAYLQLTSGTTGESRAVMATHRSLAAGLGAIAEHFGVSERDVMAAWVPLHYVPGLVRYVFGTVYFGCRTHLIPPSAFDLTAWIEMLARTGASITSAPDFAYRLAARAARHRMSLPQLRVATNGGERVRRSSIAAFEQAFGLSGVVQPSYGLSEATLVAAAGRPGDPVLADASDTVSCGWPLPGIELRIAAPDGSTCAPGDMGEICLRGAPVFSGYFHDEDETRAVLRGGWLHTGDLGTTDEEGRLYPQARTRPLIKRAGAGIPPRDLEECVEELDDVVAAAAVGLPAAERSTEDLVLVVETATDETGAAELTRRISTICTELAGVAPTHIVLVKAEWIPRTASGKILRAELKERLVRDSGLLRRPFAG